MLSLVRRRGGSASNATGVQPEPQVVEGTYNRVGPYRLCLELAAGGMATVYLAERGSENGPGQMVAVKLIHPHLASDREFIEMFMDEAELASQIRHPNVCAVLDYDLAHDEPYLVMEYLFGESLMSVAKALELSTDFDPIRLSACVARMLADACEGLHAAHELTDASGKPLNVVHRDVSLENVFVTYDGVAKVMDFGVAAASNKRHQTRTGVVKGKFASVAPECLKGRKPDRRADVWGIGVIAWELLTQQRLFRRETDVDTLCAVSEAPIRRPSECRPGLPAALDDIVMRALSRDLDQRYPTARELGRDLARFSARGGEVLTSADVAEWLRDLFPGGRERRQQILELASQVGAQGEGAASSPGSVSGAHAPMHPTPSPLPSTPEPTLATQLWLGARPGSTPPPPPPSLPRATRVPVPPFPRRGQSPWRTAALVFFSASAGALLVLLVQLLHGSSLLPQLRAWSMFTPLLPVPVSAEGAAPADVPVVVGQGQPREIVLRIRIEAPPSDPTPTMVIEPEAAAAAALEPRVVAVPADDLPGPFAIGAP